MELIHINFISRYFKKLIQLYKMEWLWISKKKEKKKRRKKWKHARNFLLGVEPGYSQTFEKLVHKFY